jgi:hypothetical protein
LVHYLHLGLGILAIFHTTSHLHLVCDVNPDVTTSKPRHPCHLLACSIQEPDANLTTFIPPVVAPLTGLGILATAQEAAEEEFEIDLNDVEPTFLKGASSK